MPPANEAECLLGTGAAFLRRTGLRPDSGPLIFAGVKPGGFAIYFGDLPYYHFDLDGRWQRVLIEGTHYLRSLDGTTESIDRVRQGDSLVLRRRRLPFAEAADLDAAIQGMALDLIEGLEDGRFQIEPPPPGITPLAAADLRDFLDRIAGWDASAWYRQREGYANTYGPWPLLPPGLPHPIVLQSSLRDPGGPSPDEAPAVACAARTPDEFREHARQVARLLGRRAALARGIFVAGTDLLHRPLDQIAALLEAAAEVFPITPSSLRPRLSERAEESPHLDGLYASLDDPSPPLPDAAGLARLRDLHLRRVDLVVGSGDPLVRQTLGHGWANDDLVHAVSGLHGVGIGVSLILLLGAGGADLADRHVQESVALLDRLALGAGDLVYLMDVDEVQGRSGTQDTGATGPEGLDEEARSAQADRLRGALAHLRTDRGVKVVRYSLDKQ